MVSFTKRVPFYKLYTIRFGTPNASQYAVNLSKDGRLLDGHVISERKMTEDGTLIVTTQHKGEDDNRPAEIRQVYGLSPTNFYIRKDIKFDDSGAYLTRNIYAFKRPTE